MPTNTDDDEGGGAGRWPPGFGAVYELEYPNMVRTARLLVGSTETAEEATQDAFIRLAARWAKVDNHAAYVRRAVINECISRLRRRTVERGHLARERRAVQSHVAGEPALPPDDSEVWTALRALTIQRRTALVLHYFEDLSVQQIAETMGRRPSTVRSLLHRGRRQLEEALS